MRTDSPDPRRLTQPRRTERRGTMYRDFMSDVGRQHSGFAIKLRVLIAGCAVGNKADFLGEHRSRLQRGIQRY